MQYWGRKKNFFFVCLCVLPLLSVGSFVFVFVLKASKLNFLSLFNHVVRKEVLTSNGPSVLDCDQRASGCALVKVSITVIKHHDQKAS